MSGHEAIDRLAGDADGADIFAKALEVLRAPSSAEELGRGAALLDQASNAGCGEATAVCAVLEAMGMGRPQSWRNALDLLATAAEQGSASARQQLVLLHDPQVAWEDVEAAAESNLDWADLRGKISVPRLAGHPAETSLSENPRVRTIEKFATASECDWLVSRARPGLARATVIKKTGARGYARGRSNSRFIFQIVDMDVVVEMIRTRIGSATRVPVPNFEPTQVLNYSVGQEFRPHHDFIDLTNPSYGARLAGQRSTTFLIYLNDGFEGGETDFPSAGLRYRGNKGDAIYWANVDRHGRPDPMTLHAGLPPTQGEKWVLSQWIRDRGRQSGGGR